MSLDLAADAAEGTLTAVDPAPRRRAAKAAGPTIQVERRALLVAAERVAKVADSKSTIPVLGSVRLEAADGVLSLLGTDMDAWVTATVEGVAGSLPPCCPPADKLAAAVKAARGEHVSLELRDGALALRHDGGRASLPILSANEFPGVEGLRGSNEAARLAFDGAGFRKLLGMALPFTSREETRFYLQGLHLARREGHLAVSATDGHRLVRADLVPTEDDGQPVNIIIPRATAALLQGLPGDGLSVLATANRIEVEGDGVVIGSRLIDGTFPDVERVIPAQRAEYTRASFAVADLVAGLEQVKWAAEKEGKTRTVGLYIPDDGGDATFWTGARDDASRATALVPCQDAAGAFSVGFQVAYFADILAYAQDCNATRLRLEAGGPEQPMRWFADEASDVLVLMPMRIGAYQPAPEDEA